MLNSVVSTSFKVIYILTAYVSFIRSGMDRYAVSSESFTVKSRLDNIRIIASAGIPESCYLIDIYT